MGFLDSFAKGLRGEEIGEQIMDVYKEEDEDALILESAGVKVDYRKRGLTNSKSVNGKYQCVRCKKWFDEGDIDIDHILPQSRGGDSTRYNLQCLCVHCNRSKQDDISYTEDDLERRRKELEKQDTSDIKWLNKTFRK